MATLTSQRRECMESLSPKCRRVPCPHNSFIFPLSDLLVHLLVQPELLVIHVCFPADQSSSPKCLPQQAGNWNWPLHTHTHTQIITDHGSHDLTAFPLLSVRLILLLWFLQHSPQFFSLFLKKAELLRQCFCPPLLLDIFPALFPLFWYQ